MTTRTPTAPPRALTLAECAAELGIAPTTVKKWIDAGQLQAFVPPGIQLGNRRPGRKTLRIWPDEWTRFKTAQTQTGHAEAPSEPVAAVESKTGSDGLSRRRAAR